MESSISAKESPNGPRRVELRNKGPAWERSDLCFYQLVNLAFTYEFNQSCREQENRDLEKLCNLDSRILQKAGNSSKHEGMSGMRKIEQMGRGDSQICSFVIASARKGIDRRIFNISRNF